MSENKALYTVKFHAAGTDYTLNLSFVDRSIAYDTYSELKRLYVGDIEIDLIGATVFTSVENALETAKIFLHR